MPTSHTSTDVIGLVSIRDAATGQDLVFDPQPLRVKLDGEPKTVVIRVQNSPRVALRLNLSTDQPWLTLNQSEIALAPNASVDLSLQATTDSPGDFAVLRLAWHHEHEEFAEHVLVMREGSAKVVQRPDTTPQPKTAPTAPTTPRARPKPSWME